MEEILSSISNYGFPIIITVFLLMRMENKLEKLTESITCLNQIMQKFGE